MAFKNTPNMKRLKTTERNTAVPPKKVVSIATPGKASSTPVPLSRRSKSSTCITYTPTSKSKSGNYALSTPKSLTRRVLETTADTPDYFNPVSLETPRRFAKSASDIVTELSLESTKEDEISNLKVAIRVRPMSVKELSNYRVKNVVSCKNNEITVTNGTTADGLSGVSHTFHYDYVFWSADTEDKHYADQKQVFDTLAKPLVDGAFEGYNVCLFAYGQTGSGKSYSMMGIDSDDPDELGLEAGITPRFCKEIFNRIEELKENFYAEVEVSYFEIYNEKIHDLLTLSSEEGFINFENANSKKSALKVREHPVFGPYVVDLSTHMVDSYKLLRDWLAVGNSQRATAATGMNDKSSRSHSIFNIVLNLTEKTNGHDADEVKLTKRSKISLVDLAGSERVCHTNASAERYKEGVSINKSLLTLGKVISALADTKKQNTFVPYRESVLTWLLRENLGGNSRTACLATISPSNTHMDETLSTLRYACTARRVTNRVRVNEAPHDKIIRELKAEVERLRALSQNFETLQRRTSINNLEPRKIIIETSVDDNEIEVLRQQLQSTEKELERAQTKWEERLTEMEEIKRAETRLLTKNGLALTLTAEEQQALLINISPNLLETGNLLYLLPMETIKIGRSSSLTNSCVDICLNATDIANHHCSIINRGAMMYIQPEAGDSHKTYLNGKLLANGQRTRIYHGDTIVLGTSHYFKVANKLCQNMSGNKNYDFQSCHEEILSELEKRLRHEWDQDKRNAVRKTELACTKKLSDYHQKMTELESEVARLKKEFIQQEKSRRRSSQMLLKSPDLTDVTEESEDAEYTSFLLQEIQEILSNPDQDLLKQYQQLVKDANEWMQNKDLPFTFKLSLPKEDSFTVTSIQITDISSQKEATWSVARLQAWVDATKDNFIEKLSPFALFDIEWTEMEEDESKKKQPEPTTPSKIFSRLNDLRNSLTKSPLQHIRSFMSSNSPPKSRRQLLPDSNDKENQDLQNQEKNNFTKSAKTILLDVASSNIKLKRLCRKRSKSLSNTTDDDQNVSLAQLKTNMLKSSEKIESIVHQMNLVLTENTIKDSSPNISKSPSKAVKFLIE